jgi:Uncharacterised protein family (UPF0220)
VYESFNFVLCFCF